MKSSSSSSSFSSNSFGSKSLTFGCISGILRRFLCSGSLPTYPSNQIAESDSKFCDFHKKSQFNNVERIRGRGNGPGVVVRLMGLDSMPETDLGSSRMLSGSITRSRSMNSVACYRGERDQIEGRHRRVKSTLGLHQVPAFIELEDENFFVLSFEQKGSEIREFGLKEGKSEKGFGESEQQKTGKSKSRRRRTERDTGEGKQRKAEEHEQRNMEDKENNWNALNAAEENEKMPEREKFGCNRLEDSVESYSPLKDGDMVLVDAKLRKRTKKKMTSTERKCPLGNEEEDECCSPKESSPVSVLDFHRFVAVRETPGSEKSSRKEEPSTRRRLSPELEANGHNHEATQEDRRTMKIRSRKFDGYNHNYPEMWLEICRITETKIDESKWVHREVLKHEGFEEINKDVVSRLLDQLLEETIDQLANFTREDV